ncbi:MAG TPA: sulfate adenylyltransferase [Dehalococcoidales bacterium]|nr:sulfate adenylyltransferase [Dehalococcoidales bacterium]
MVESIPPHGGKLIPLLAGANEKEELLKEAQSLPVIALSSKELSDLIMLAMGAFSPLQGFLGKEDYQRVVEEMRLVDGLLWPIPITLSTSKEEADRINEGEKIALLNPDDNEIAGSMIVEEKYFYDKEVEALQVFGTDDEQHPGVQKIYGQGEVYLGGPVKILSEGGYPQRFTEFARPAETRAIFADKGWKTIAAFQTRNPLHRSHEYLTKIALEVCDGLFIHPIVGRLKEGDIPAEVRMECYQALLDNYYPKDRVILKVYPMEMRYAGPKEAILHAIIRQNFGCSHLIIGRDHAGVGSYYGPFDAQIIFDELKPDDLYIQPLKLDTTFWCNKCASMASPKTCPHANEDHLAISGTELRQILSRDERPPEEFSRKEVIDILVKYYKSKILK